MLTPEQIKNLKPGDNLALSYPLHFREYDSEHDELLAENNGEYIYFHAADVSLPSEHGTSVPPPKHDPCRLFKEGDIVETVERDGRDYKDMPPLGARCCVCDDEKDGIVAIVYQVGSTLYKHNVPFCHLELVTPVEEQEPYYVGDCKDDPDCPFFYIQNNNNEISYGLLEEVARYVYNTDYTADKETVRKRAEAECDRLNAEWRKEQNNE